MQRDLFNDPMNEPSSNPSENSEGFLHRYQITLGLDQILLVTIALIGYSCLIYGLGVWTGGRVSWKDLFSRPAKVAVVASESAVETSSIQKDEAKTQGELEKTLPSAISEEAHVLPAPREEPGPAEEEVSLSSSVNSKGKFTIQVVAYKQLKEANRFSSELAQKGLQSFVLTQKKYHNVCVANFQSKQTARQFLAELKTQGWFPKDAYVRNIA